MLFNGSVRIYIKLRGKRLQFVLCKKIINNGYIGHSGILLTLHNKEWLDKTIVCELQFDYSNNRIIYIEKMLLPARLCGSDILENFVTL